MSALLAATEKAARRDPISRRRRGSSAGPMVRIRLPPPVSLQTLGPSGLIGSAQMRGLSLAALTKKPHALQVARDTGWSFATVWRRAESAGIELTAGRCQRIRETGGRASRQGRGSAAVKPEGDAGRGSARRRREPCDGEPNRARGPARRRPSSHASILRGLRHGSVFSRRTRLTMVAQIRGRRATEIARASGICHG